MDIAVDEKVVIELGRVLPLESGDKVTSLTMREPLVNDQLVMDKMAGSPVEKEIKIFANLCGITPNDIQKLSVRNYKKLQAAYETFTV